MQLGILGHEFQDGMFQGLVREISHLCSVFLFFLTSLCVFCCCETFFFFFKLAMLCEVDFFILVFDAIPNSRLNQIEWKI